MATLSKKFGAEVKRLRIAQGITQVQFAELVGAPQSNVSAIEAGKQGVSATRLAKIATALGVSVDSLASLLNSPTGSLSVGKKTFPVVGMVPAGKPSDALASFDTFDFSIFGDDAFMLRVSGCSMSGDGILDGDWVLVRPGIADSGQIVVVMLDGQATVKRLVRQSSRWMLVASHQDYPPTPISPADKAGIVGAVVGVVRAY